MQEARLIAKRKMTPAEARTRIAAQGPQKDKLNAAHVIIDNNGSFEDTWTQVQTAFNKILRPARLPSGATTPLPANTGPLAVRIRRGLPSDATAIAAFIKQATRGRVTLARADVIAAFGDKAYMLAELSGHLAAVAGWKVENLVARVDELYVLPGAPLDELAPPILEAVETASRELQSEAALVFVPTALAQAAAAALAVRGFTPSAPEKLSVAAWVEAARESMPAGSALLFKRLREDRVLRPI
jgi:dephospho-CoA kinase